MRAVPNSFRRHGVFYFRRAIPRDLRALLNRAELCCSLRTSDIGAARGLSRSLYLRSEELFEIARSSPMLSEADLARIVQEFYARVLEQDNHWRLASAGPLDESMRLALVARYSELAESTRKDLARSNFGAVDEIGQWMIQKHGLSGKLDRKDERLVQQALLRAGIDLAEAVRARFEGDFNLEPRDKLLKAAIANAAAAPQPQPGINPAAEPKPPQADTPLFTAVAEEFRLTQARLKVWEQQTALQARKTYQLFAEMCGDKPLSAYTKQDATRFKSVLLELPDNYSKAVQYRGMTAEEIANATRSQDLPRISPRTVKRHLTALSALWDSGAERGELSANIFKGFKLPAQKRAQDQRSMWTTADLDRLFATPVWRGCQSAARRSKPGKLVKRDEKYWLPLIALYSGMRQEEICQLHVADVRRIDGVWVFDINAAPPRQLKNQNAVRLVPVHKELIRLGLLGYVEGQRKAGHVLVFDRLTPGGADNRLGHNFTKWFTRYRREVGLYEPKLDFHSLRHSATTFLQRAKVPVALIDALTGHSTPGETARYSKGYEVIDLQEAINKLNPRLSSTTGPR
jgi:integrase